jgi:uncharacterized spore protein YtfJ
MENLTERLADAVPSWGAKLAYGEKTTVDGQELLPVAVVIFGFGAGQGSGEMPDGNDGPAKSGEGSGGGGGGYAVPIGAYVGSASGPVFQPNPIALMAVVVPLVSAAGWAVARIIRALS